MSRVLAVVSLIGFSFVALPLPANAATGASPAEGEKIYIAQKCSLCHAVAGKGNKMGPLDGVGTKLTAAELREWIVDPVAMGKKQGGTRKPPMKSFASLPKAEIDALVEYLQTLKTK